MFDLDEPVTNFQDELARPRIQSRLNHDVRHAIILNKTNEPIKDHEGKVLFFASSVLLTTLKGMYGTLSKTIVLSRCSLICES